MVYTYFIAPRLPILNLSQLFISSEGFARPLPPDQENRGGSEELGTVGQDYNSEWKGARYKTFPEDIACNVMRDISHGMARVIS